MTSISSVSAYSAPAPVQASSSAVDNDGDHDGGRPDAASSRGPATTVTLSPQAQAALASQKAG
jgi:hypothetical protein